MFPVDPLGLQTTSAKAARNLGVIFDTNFSFRSHVSAVCRSCRYHIRDLRRIRRYLSFDSANYLHTPWSPAAWITAIHFYSVLLTRRLFSFNVFKIPWLVLLLRNHL